MNCNIVIGPDPLCVVWPQYYQRSVSHDYLDFSCCSVCWNHADTIRPRCLQWESRRCYKARVFAVRCQHFQKMENLHRELDNIWGRDRTLPWWLRIRKVKWWVAYKPRLTSTITITSFMYLTWNQFLFEFTHLYNFILFYIMYYSWHVLYLTYCFYCGFVEC